MENITEKTVTFDGRIDNHPLHKAIYDLCGKIEKLAASEQATICVSAASALQDQVAAVLTPFRNLLLASENADETGYVDGEGWLPLEDIQAAARTALAGYVTSDATIIPEQPCLNDFVVIASGEPFRFRRSSAHGGAIWAYCWHKHQKSWVSSREVSDADAQRAFLTALPVEQAKHYEGGVPFL